MIVKTVRGNKIKYNYITIAANSTIKHCNYINCNTDSSTQQDGPNTDVMTPKDIYDSYSHPVPE